MSWPTIACQEVPAGFSQPIRSLSPGVNSVQDTPRGLVYFDGTDLWLESANQPPRSLLHFPSFTFGSFSIAVGPDFVLFGEVSTNGMWLVPVMGPAPTQALAQVVYNYDAVLLSPDRVLISAKTGGFSTPDNEIVLLDLTSGATQVVARLPGASGPLTLADSGDLFYATASQAFPTPPGSVALLRFRRPVLDQAILLQQVLDSSSVDTVYAGLDAAGDIAFDQEGDLFFIDWYNNRIGEIRHATGLQPSLGTTLVDYGTKPLGSAALQFLSTDVAFAFEPFQPAGARMVVHETDYASANQLRTLQARRPILSVTGSEPIATGDFDLVVNSGPANGMGLMAIADAAMPGSLSLSVAGFEQPLDWSLGLQSGLLLIPFSLDAHGAGRTTLHNPGFNPGLMLAAQGVLIGVTNVIASSQLRILHLSQ